MEPTGRDRTSPSPPRDASPSHAEVARARRYYTRIENRIVALRGGGFILSPRDFQILEDWYERGVPAELVIATLEEVFEKKADRSESRRPWTIAYCRKAVERAWEERRAALLGVDSPREARGRSGPAGVSTGTAFTTAQIAAHLSSVAEKTVATAAGSLWSEQAVSRAQTGLAAIAQKLDTLREALGAGGAADLPALEEELVGLEERAIDVARDALPPADLEAITSKATADMEGATARMSAKAREAMLRRTVDAAIRRRLGLPRYSLFTMTP